MYKSIYKLFKLVLQPVLLKKGRKMSQPKSLSTYVIFSNFWDGIHALKIKIEWEKLAVDTHLNLRVQNDYILHKYFLENILILVAKNKGIFSIFQYLELEPDLALLTTDFFDRQKFWWFCHQKP